MYAGATACLPTPPTAMASTALPLAPAIRRMHRLNIEAAAEDYEVAPDSGCVAMWSVGPVEVGGTDVVVVYLRIPAGTRLLAVHKKHVAVVSTPDSPGFRCASITAATHPDGSPRTMTALLDPDGNTEELARGVQQFLDAPAPATIKSSGFSRSDAAVVNCFLTMYSTPE